MKKIGLLDIDYKNAKRWSATTYPNLALCKIAAWHKSQGDAVEWATHFEHYDILYRSKIFNFSEDDLRVYDFDKEVRGGTGYSIDSKLPDEIDNMQPDLSIYPNLPTDTSFGFLTRGCHNKCQWCVVPQKEGHIRPYWDIDRVANGRKNVVLMDNNILAAGEYCTEQLEKIIERGYRIDFNQAIDARLVNEQNAKQLARIKWMQNRIRFGCDKKAQIAECQRAIDLIVANGYKGDFFLYTMLHGDFDECFERVNYWREKNLLKRRENVGSNVYPYAQPYRDPRAKNTPPQWQKDLAAWCNKRMIFEKIAFEDFEPRKGFTCKSYFKNSNI